MPHKYAVFAVVPSADGMTAHVPLLSLHDTIRGYVLIDIADAEWVGQWRWHLTADGYASRSESKGRGIRLHRALLGLTRGDGVRVDHINRNRLDDRRSNLRIATAAENAQNMSSHPGTSSRFRGVFWSRQAKKWSAQIKVEGKSRHLGFFTSEEDAAEVARIARLMRFPGATD